MTRPKAEICSPVRMSHFGWITVIVLLTPLLMRADEVRSGESPAQMENALAFDADRDRVGMLAQRLLANELDAIAICQRYVEAQTKYSHQVHDQRGKLEYAQRIVSSPGKQDGLYSNSSGGGSQS